MIRAIFGANKRCGVKAALNPVVLNPDTDSYSASIALTSGILIKITIVVANDNTIPPANKVNASNTVVVSILRFRKDTSVLPRNTLKMVATKTTMVVVLIPPAVEPGEPPINIKQMSINFVTECSAAGSIAEKPAVRELADWNRLTNIF